MEKYKMRFDMPKSMFEVFLEAVNMTEKNEICNTISFSFRVSAPKNPWFKCCEGWF